MIVSFLLGLLRSYLILTFGLTVFNIIKMYWVRNRVNARGFGFLRLQELRHSDRYVIRHLYTPEEIKNNSKLNVARISFFPADEPKSQRTIIICPGGGYAHLDIRVEGFPIAARYNQAGFNAFILEYRTGFFCSPHAPMQDLARAIEHIRDNADFYGVNPDDYVLVGFSAGGNLCGMFGTRKYGYEKYGLKKPTGLILGYPWTNINHWIEHPYWNIWVGLLAIWLSERGNIYMFGLLGHYNRENRDSICLQNWIDEDYPDTYMFACSGDVLVPCGAHADVMEVALREKNIRHKYEKFFKLPHGIGLGIGTPAEVWFENSLDFMRYTSDNPVLRK